MDVLNTEVSRYRENIFQHSEILFITREVLHKIHEINTCNKMLLCVIIIITNILVSLLLTFNKGYVQTKKKQLIIKSRKSPLHKSIEPFNHKCWDNHLSVWRKSLNLRRQKWKHFASKSKIPSGR